jgi:uroporphyrin-III C-methyltransferase/precorrin-2 dehydrogenase/sirohydrochlorin ferrochelatase
VAVTPGYPGYPATLRLEGRRVLVVGAGTVATRRIPALIDAGAVIDVVALDALPEIRDAAAAGRVRWRQRRFQPRDVVEPEPAWLVHATTDSPSVNAEVARASEEHRIWCVRADDADRSSAWTPAVARGAEGTAAEGVTVAVTGGGDPKRAAAVRDAVLAGLDSGLLPVRRQRSKPAAVPAAGRVALVGGGPGDPGLVTVRGRQLLAAADVVVTDRLGPRDLLDAVGPDVEVIDVGKTPGHHPIPQQRINEILVEHARRGCAVVRLKGGDPFVLGRGGEEAIHCVANGIPWKSCPG